MISYFESPVGWLEIVSSDNTLRAIRFREDEPDSTDNEQGAFTEKVNMQLSEYFSRERTTFSIPLEPEGTDFQQTVWNKLRDIPFGQTTTYGQLARALGDPNKVRAVSTANGRNPIPIVIPCHRVIGADHKMVGYAGGIARKKFLLRLEGAILL